MVRCQSLLTFREVKSVPVDTATDMYAVVGHVEVVSVESRTSGDNVPRGCKLLYQSSCVGCYTTELYVAV